MSHLGFAVLLFEVNPEHLNFSECARSRKMIDIYGMEGLESHQLVQDVFMTPG